MFCLTPARTYEPVPLAHELTKGAHEDTRAPQALVDWADHLANFILPTVTGKASVGAYFRKKARYGIAYKNFNPGKDCGYFSCTPRPGCTMSGCVSLKSQDCPSGWCSIKDVTQEHGGHGPDISGLGKGLVAELTLTPLLQLTLHGGWVVGSLQLDAKAMVTIAPNSPLCSGRRALANESQVLAFPAAAAAAALRLDPSLGPGIATVYNTTHASNSAIWSNLNVRDESIASRQEIELGFKNFVQATGHGPTSRRSLQSKVLIKVEIDAAFYAWATIDVYSSTWGSIYRTQSDVFTVFSSLKELGLTAPFKIIPPVCISGLIETSTLASSKPVRADTRTTLQLGNRVSHSYSCPP